MKTIITTLLLTLCSASFADEKLPHGIEVKVAESGDVGVFLKKDRRVIVKQAKKEGSSVIVANLNECPGVEELGCTLGDSALVSRSYTSGETNAFIERCLPTSDSDCGWYVGVVDETLDLNDVDSFVHQSLYELTIADRRFARFWLLPVGYRIYFDSAEPRT